MKKIILFSFFTSLIFSQNSFSRINAHIFLRDYHSAFIEAEKGLEKDPSQEMKKLYVKTVCLNGKERDALNFLKEEKELKHNRDVLEDISWCILKKGLASSLYSIKFSSLIGIYFTRSAKSTLLIKKMIKSPNAILRAIAVRLSCDYADDVLKEEILDQTEKENVWFVRMELFQAIGRLKINQGIKYLKKALKEGSFEEKKIAIASFGKIYDSINISELEKLLKSSFSGLRSLGCRLALKFKVEEVKENILELLQDPIVEVKLQALNAISFFYKDLFEKEKIKKALEAFYHHQNPYVAITSLWAAVSLDKNVGGDLKKRALDQDTDSARFASAAIAHVVAYFPSLACDVMRKSEDPFVKVNIAISLISQRKYVKESSDVIFKFIQNKEEMWMRDDSINEIFSRIMPNRLRHIDQYPNYPKAIDQSVELDLLSMLAMLEDKRAEEALRKFLKEDIWGISGLAAVTILKEGDEESIDLLRNLLKEEDENIRVQAALALASFGKDPTVLPVLEKAYVRADRNLKLLILEAIGKIGTEESFDFLINILYEPFLFLRIAAASSIIQILNF